MRYYSYMERDEQDNDVIITVSEDHIRETYFPYWTMKIEQKYGPDHDFCFLDCIDDWMVVNLAWEVDL